MLGYLAFLALLFAPGLAVILLLRQAQGSSVSLLARSYGLSLVLNSLVSFADGFAGIPFSLLAVAELALSLLAMTLVAVLGGRSRFSAWKASQSLGEQAPPLILGLLSGSLLFGQFIKFPIFPKTYSVDFSQHVQLVQSLLANNGTNAAWTLLYGGVHYNLALGLSLEGGEAFTQLPFLMAILAAPSSLLLYEVASRLYGGKREALLTQLLFVATGFVWYVPLYDSGLYPNLFSVLVSMAYLVELVRLNETRSLRTFLIFFLLSLGLYLSHYSVVLFIASVDLYILYRVIRRTQSLRFFLGVVLANLAPAALVLARPDLLSLGAQILGSSGTTGAFSFTTSLADAFQFSPFLRYLVAEVYGDTAVVLLVFALPLAVYYLWHRRRDNLFLPLILVWFGLIWILSPRGDLAWRFSNQALAPLLVLAPATFDPIARGVRSLVRPRSPRPRKRRRVPRRRISVSATTVITGILVILVFIGSWTNIMITDLSSSPTQYSQAQESLYDSMTWFSQNTPAGSSLLSVTDWRITFMQQLVGRNGILLFLANSTQAVSYAKSNGYGYVLVTYFIPAEIPAGFDATSFYNSFSKASSLRMVYNSTLDVIYQVVAT